MVRNVRTTPAAVYVAAIAAVLAANRDSLTCLASAGTGVAGQTATPAFTENLVAFNCRLAYELQVVDMTGDGAVDILVGKLGFAYCSNSCDHPSTCRCRM